MDTPKMLLTHAINAYALMKKGADEVEGQLVWTGFTTHLICGELNLSVPYYSQVLKCLKTMGCVRQLRRGGSSTPSQWLLVQEPTEELFEMPKGGKSTGPQSRTDVLETQVLILANRLDTVEALLRQGIELSNSG